MRDLRQEVLRRLAGADLEPARALEIADEIAQDLEDRVADLIARGRSPAEAEAAALAQLDDHDVLAAELARVERAPAAPPVVGAPRQGVLADLWRDLRYGARSLVRSPVFTAVTMLSLALGIGANTAIFQLIDSLNLRSLPVREPERLASIKIGNFESKSGSFNSWHADLTNPLWELLRAEHEPFESVLAWSEQTFDLAPGGEVEEVRGLYVSGGFFATLGVPAQLGRVFTASDDRRGCGAAPGVVVSHGFWQRRLGGDPAAVGGAVSLGGHRLEIVGVTPPSFHGLEMGRTFDVAVPICMDDLFRREDSRLDVRHAWWLSVVGRLRPGWTVERAGANLDALSPRLFDATIPPRFQPGQVEMYRAYRLGASPGARGISALRDEYSRALVFLLLTASAVLLIACANLASLLLARASAREREIAIRLALGASRGRLVRQLMTESALLAAAGAALGLLLAGVLARLLLTFLATPGAALEVDLTPDGRVLGFAAGLAALTCLVFGLAPALRASGADLGLVIRAAGVHGATQRQGLRRVLVAIQVALSAALLIAALLFARSLHNLSTVRIGFDPGVLVVQADLRRMEVPPSRWPAVQHELLARVRAAPGAAAAGSAEVVPLSGEATIRTFHKEGSREDLDLLSNWVSPDSFRTLGMTLLAGRDFAASDTLGAPAVAIVNQSFVRRYLAAGQSPLGRRLHAVASSSRPASAMEIVGVVADIKVVELREDPQPIVFMPAAQDTVHRPDRPMLLVRASGPPRSAIASVQQAIAEVSPRIGVKIDRLDRMVDGSIQRERLLATVSGFFGLLAALLAAIGLYGVVAYSVARRSHEIGIRMALGADRRRIAAMVLRETALLLALGLGAGLLLAVATTRAAAGLLYGLSPRDPLTFLVAAGLLAAVALAASALPARRAASVDPAVALRDE